MSWVCQCCQCWLPQVVFYFISPQHFKITINLCISFSVKLGRAQPRTWMLSLLQVVFVFMFYFMAGRLFFILFFLQHSKITINMLVSFPAGTWQSPASGSIIGIFENNQPAGGSVVAMWQKNCGFGSNVHHWKLCGARGNASGMWCSPVW